jgi:hypothetical protein
MCLPFGAQDSPLCAAMTAEFSCSTAAHSGGSARGYLAVGGPLSSPGMAYLMIACSVYLYIAIRGATVRICR